jgi:peptide deformylase
MVYPIVKLGDPVLEREAADVTEFDTPELHKFLDDMFESMYAAKGVGLAAPQIGFGRKIAVIDVSNGERPEDKLVLINPTIVKVDGKQEGEEGCLSIPGFREQVKRGRSVTIRAQNAKGEVFEQTGEDLLARAFLHETDHPYGLYITHISAEARPDETQDQAAARGDQLGAHAPGIHGIPEPFQRWTPVCRQGTKWRRCLN